MKPLEANTLAGGPSFSFANRLFRFAWNVTWFFLGAWTPPFLFPWRRLLLRVFGAKIAVGACVYGSTRIWYPPNLRMEENATMGPSVNCYCMAKVTMGPNSIVSQGAHLCAGTHDIDDPNFQLRTRPIEIGAQAWIAAEAFVGPGVIVADGAVLGARAVTFTNLSSWSVYVGNPARKVRDRPRWETPS